MMTDIFLAAPISTTGEDCLASCKNKLRTMVKQESMPLLKPAVVRRILIMPYQSKDAQIWNGSRHDKMIVLDTA
jgi:hypothetical protein